MRVHMRASSRGAQVTLQLDVARRPHVPVEAKREKLARASQAETRHGHNALWLAGRPPPPARSYRPVTGTPAPLTPSTTCTH